MKLSTEDALTNQAKSADTVLSSLTLIWEEALGEKITIWSGSFFDNGGDSMGATIVLVEIKAQFEVNVTLEDFFDAPSLTMLAQRITFLRDNM
jgi:acyl carrier protein